MNNFEKQIKKAAEGVNLSHTERAKMRSVLTQYMGMKPRRASESYSISVSYRWFSFAHRPIAAALVLCLIFGSSVTYAAENALPGDILYAVKTYVNEPTRVALATNAEAKAEVQIELAERRIEEAAVLAAEGRLDSETEEDLAVAFESHAEAAATHMEEADEEDESASVELASRFETRLAAHENVLLEVESSDESEHSPRLAEAIRLASANVVNIRTGSAIALAANVAADTSIAIEMTAPDAASGLAPSEEPTAMTMSIAADLPATAPSENARSAKLTMETTVAPARAVDAKTISRMKSGAEKALKNAQKKLKGAKSLSAEARVRAEADIKLAGEMLEDGDDFLDSDLDADAYASFQESLRLSESASVYIKAAPTLEKARSRAKNARTNVEARTDIRNEAHVEISAPNVDVDATVTLPLPVEPARTNDSHKGDEDQRAADDDDSHDGDDRPQDDSDTTSQNGFNFLNKLNISL